LIIERVAIIGGGEMGGGVIVRVDDMGFAVMRRS